MIQLSRGFSPKNAQLSQQNKSRWRLDLNEETRTESESLLIYTFCLFRNFVWRLREMCAEKIQIVRRVRTSNNINPINKYVIAVLEHRRKRRAAQLSCVELIHKPTDSIYISAPIRGRSESNPKSRTTKIRSFTTREEGKLNPQTSRARRK